MTEEISVHTSFQKTLHEFLNDLEMVYPEYKTIFENHRQNLEANIEYYISWFHEINDKYFLDITAKNEKLFTESSVPIELLPDIDFRILWHCDISDNTKQIIWKYLHLLLLYIFKCQTKGNDFSETINKWNEMLDTSSMDDVTLHTMKEQTEKMMKLIENLTSEENNTIPLSEESIENDPFIKKLEKSKIAKLAEELAQEFNLPTSKMDISDTTPPNPMDAANNMFQLLGKDPKKLLNLVKNVGVKIQERMSCGEFRQEDLLQEAQDILGSMKNSKTFQSMLNKKGNKALNPMELLKTFTSQLSSQMTSSSSKSSDEDDDPDSSTQHGFDIEQMTSMIQSMMSHNDRRNVIQERLRRKLLMKKKNNNI